MDELFSKIDERLNIWWPYLELKNTLKIVNLGSLIYKILTIFSL